MHRKIIGAPFVMLALALVGCPNGGDEIGGDDELGEDEELGEEELGEEQLGEGQLGVDAPAPDCDFDDNWEPNPSAEHPSLVTWQSADAWTAYRQILDAGLCAGEDDWYHYDVESLGYVEHYLYIRALIDDAGLCGPDCGQPMIPSGPQHAMTLEVYRADNMQLLSSHTGNDGVMVINGPGGDAYAHDLLLHVFSPTVDAGYSYRLSVEIRNYDGEDECEC